MQRVHVFRLAVIATALLSLLGYTKTSADGDRRLEGPFTYGNLSLFIVHGESSGPHDNLLTLDEALAKDYVTVYETGDVDELAIANHSDYPVYVPSGSIVKGGRQDRVVRDDLLLAARSGKLPVSSFCVERGRWSGRVDADAERFETAAYLLPTTDLKIAAKVQQSQGDVWSRVAAMQDSLATKVRGGRASNAAYTTSLPMTMENKVVKEILANPLDSLLKLITLSPNAIGLVAIINNRCASADLYDSPRLFQKMYPKLLEAANVEAVTVQSDSVSVAAPTLSEIAAFIDHSQTPLPEIRRSTGGVITNVHTLDGKVNFETFVDGRSNQWIHKNVLNTK